MHLCEFHSNIHRIEDLGPNGLMDTTELGGPVLNKDENISWTSGKYFTTLPY